MDKNFYKTQYGILLSENSKLKEQIEDLETKLYFKERNHQIERMTEIGKQLTEEMGFDDDTLTELGDLLDDVMKEQDDKNDQRNER